MATAAQVNAFRSNTAALVTLARRDLEAFWRSLDLSDALAVKVMLQEFLPDLVQTYGSTAALLAADYYDELRDLPPSAGRFRAVMAEPVPVGQAQAVARWGVTPLFSAEPNATEALGHISGAVQRLVMQPARDTVIESARSDPSITGVARVPSGSETCAFCLMLASRGAVYGSKAAAGDMNKYHSLCDCVPTPIRSRDDFPEGYDVDALYEQYATAHEVGMSGKETAAALRSQYDIK